MVTLRYCVALSCLYFLLLTTVLSATGNDLEALSKRIAADEHLLFVRNGGQIIDNLGQSRPDILFTARSGNAQVYFSQQRVHYVFQSIEADDENYPKVSPLEDRSGHMVSRKLHRVDMELVGSNPAARIVPGEQTEAYTSYYLAHCQNGIENIQEYGRLVYRDIYPHIDLEFYAVGNKLKYDFIVRPGGRVQDIALRYIAADGVELTSEGTVRVTTSLGTIEEEKPYCYQWVSKSNKNVLSDSEKEVRPVRSRYVVNNDVVRFETEAYDHSQTFIIDPGVLFSTFYGGSQADAITDIATDNESAVIVTGYTSSPVFAATTGAYQGTFAGVTDAFITKFTRKGQRLWSTYLGGTKDDRGYSVAVDSNGSIIVGGQTYSADMPDTLGYIDTLFGSSPDGFIFKFTRNGARVWGSYLGGQYTDVITALAVNAQGQIFFTGTTNSDRYTFPVLNPMQNTFNGVSDGFVGSMNNGGGLLWNTFYGGREDDYANGIAIDHTSGNLYIVGTTASPDLSGVNGRFQSTKLGYADAFVLKLAPNGNFVWATYYGGNNDESGVDIATDGSGNIIFVGQTISGDFPTRNALIPQRPGDGTPGRTDFFVAKMNGNCQQIWSTYYGGADSSDLVAGVAVSRSGMIAVTGYTSSEDIPLTANALQRTLLAGNPAVDIFLVMMTPAGDTTLSTYYGGFGVEYPESITFDRMENVLIAGYTVNAGFPMKNAYQSTPGGMSDGFMMRYGCDVEVTVTPDKPTSFCQGGSVKLDAGTGYSSYLWNTGATTQTITVSTSGSFSVRVVDDLKCSTLSSVIIVDVHPLPLPVIVSTTPTTFCEGENVVLMLDRAYASYRWSDNSTGATLLVTKAGTYSVTVTDGNGCSAGTSTSIVVRPVPSVAYRTTMDFGLIPGCRSDAVDTISIRNTGSEEIELVGADISNAEFSILPVVSSPIKLSVSNRQQFSVRFRPSGLGVVTGTLTFRVQPCNREYVITLRGEKQSVTSVTSNVSTLNFGAQYLCGNKSYDTTITIYNGGNEAVTIEAGKTTAPFNADNAGLPKSVNPGDSIRIPVRYTPTAEGLHSGELAVPYVSGNCEDTLRFVLGGSAIDGTLSADVPTIDFGSLSGCEDATSATFSVRAAGTANVSVRSVSGDENFGVLTMLPVEMTPGSERELNLEFRPKSEGTFNGTLRIVYTVGECEKEITVAVSGRKEGVSFAIPSTVDFGELVGCVSQSSVATITLGVSGGGGVDGEVRSVNVQGPFSTTLAAGEQLVSGQTKAYSVNFTPGNAGEYTGSLTVVLEPCGITKVIELRGRRSEASMTTDVTTIDYGTLEEGNTTRQSISVNNNGTTAIWLERIEGVTAPFAVVAPAPVLPMRLAPGDRLVVQIEYTATVGTQQTQLRFETDQPCALNSVVSLRGTGEAKESIRGEATIAIPADLKANVDARDYRIPVVLVSQSNLREAGADGLTMTVTYDATVYHLRDVSVGTMQMGTRDGNGNQTVQISISGVSSHKAGDILTELIGDVLLGKSETTALSIDAVEWTGNTTVQTQTSSGLLTVEGICEADGARLLNYTGSFGIMSIHPNPLTGSELSIEVSTIEAGETTLEMYNSAGIEVYKERWFGSDDSRKIAIPESVPTGTYLVVLRSPSRQATRHLVIVR